MLVENQKASVRWAHNNRDHLESHGYTFTKYNDEVLVNPYHLQDNSNAKVRVVCDYCKTEYVMSWQKFMRAKNKNQTNACCACSGKKVANSTLSQRQENIFKNVQDFCIRHDYILETTQDQIVNNQSKIQYICPKHGRTSTKATNIQQGKICYKCSRELAAKHKWLSNIEQRKIYAAERISECGGILLNQDEYINQDTQNLKVLCPTCGNEFVTSLIHFIQHGGQQCKSCSAIKSVGEARIAQYLDSNKISYEREKTFDECRDRRPLPFDFYLPEFNLCIEFDGAHHYGLSQWDQFEYVKAHDEIKNQYCKDNSIGLLRIAYWDCKNIKQILDSKLNLHEDIV